MPVERKWIEVKIRIPIDIEEKDHLVYITTPVFRGFLISKKSKAEALAHVGENFENHCVVISDSNPVG